ncbi:phosphatidylserine/phosphatidylglycerophosphate/cardiolipin synthase family protein [Elusimicrobiota bacterium]
MITNTAAMIVLLLPVFAFGLDKEHENHALLDQRFSAPTGKTRSGIMLADFNNNPVAAPGPAYRSGSFSIFNSAEADTDTGYFPLREGSIAILPNGEDALAARIQTIRKARESIRIQSLIFRGDESGLYISKVLKEKKKELGSAIDIRIIVDAISNRDWNTQWMYFDLQQHGITVEGYESFYLQWINEIPIPSDYAKFDMLQVNKRFHDKLWIVDAQTKDAVAIIGGFNIANEYFCVNPSNADRTWRDQDIMVKGEVVEDLVEAFERNFNDSLNIKRNRGLANTNFYWKLPRKAFKTFTRMKVPFEQDRQIKKRVREYAGRDLSHLRFVKAKCRFLHHRPRHGQRTISTAYIRMINEARSEILISNAFFIPSPKMNAALKNAARRGAKTVIITNSTEANEHPEIAIVGRGYYHDLLKTNLEGQENSNMEIWEWQGKRADESERSQGLLHSKYAVFDRKAGIVGSFNFDPRSDKLNSETVLVFESGELASHLAELFHDKDLSHSRKITLEEANGFEDPQDAREKLQKWYGDIFKELL